MMGWGCSEFSLTDSRGGSLSLTSTMPRPAVRAARQIRRTRWRPRFPRGCGESRFVRFLRMAIPAGIALVALVIVGAASL